MKLIIYVILFGILLIYINNHSKKLTKEEFTNSIFKNVDNYQAVNPYEIINKSYFKANQINGPADNVVAHNENSNSLNNTNNWIIKNSNYSDIFNGQDLGGEQINKILDYNKPKKLLDKAMNKIVFDDINKIQSENKTQSENMQNKNLSETLKQKALGEKIPEIKQVLEKYKYPIDIKHNTLNYNLLGIAYNTFYRQYYLLYETKTKQINTNLVLRERLDNLEYATFTYALVKIEKSQPVIKYIFGPRTKININDVVYLSQGPLQLGPLLISNI